MNLSDIFSRNTILDYFQNLINLALFIHVPGGPSLMC